MAHPSARELARQILARDLARVEPPTAVSAAAAAEVAIHRISDNLVRWVGTDGSQALFARALSLAQAQDQSLTVVPPPARSALLLDGLAASAESRDAGTVVAGVVLILASLIELLDRLVGNDLTLRLVEISGGDPSSDGVRASGAESTS